MTELNKYYTPSINQLFVGYQCEIESNKIWYPETILGISTKENIVECNGFDYYINKDLSNVRTPYLSVEDIEKEGWKLSNYSWIYQDYESFKNKDVLEHIRLFEKDDLKLYFQSESKNISIYKKDSTLFNGETKSINEFRYITKLLKI